MLPQFQIPVVILMARLPLTAVKLLLLKRSVLKLADLDSMFTEPSPNSVQGVLFIITKSLCTWNLCWNVVVVFVAFLLQRMQLMLATNRPVQTRTGIGAACLALKMQLQMQFQLQRMRLAATLVVVVVVLK